MTVTDEVVRYTKDTGNVSSVTVNVDKNVAVGSTVILVCNHPVTGTVTGWTVTDTKGNTYTKRGSNQATPLNYQVVLFDSKLTTALVGGTDTITIAVTGASPAKWCVQAIAANDLDVFDKGNNGSGTGTALSVAALSVAAQNAQLEVGVFAWTDAVGAVNMTGGTGYTTVPKTTASPASTGRSMQLEYQYVNAAGTRNASGTLDSSQGWGGVMAAYNQKIASTPIAYLFDGSTSTPLLNPTVI
jgi:hypothetical protein